MNGVELIAAERRRQIEEKGFTPERDDLYKDGQLAVAASCHAVWSVPDDLDVLVVTGLGQGHGTPDDAYPWEPELDSREKHSPLENLVTAGALIAAEIDRVLRAEKRAAEDEG